MIVIIVILVVMISIVIMIVIMIYCTRSLKSEIVLENATDSPSEDSSDNPLGQVTILWEIPLESEITWENATESPR